MIDVKKIGEFIKQKRKEKNLTQRDLANKLSVTDRAISKWERGICCPDISLLKELSSILEISINELLSGENIEKLEVEQSEDILVETVKNYTAIEQKKHKKLWIFTIILLIFYVGLVFAMYLTYNQVNKNDHLNWYTYSNKKTLDKFFTALENYDYETLKKMDKDSYTNGIAIVEEDEKKCDEYREQREKSDILSGPGTICKLKYFEEVGLKLVSHDYLYQSYINGSGEWAVMYNLTFEYNDTKIYFAFSGFVRNVVIAEMNVGLIGDSIFDTNIADISNKIFSLKILTGKNKYFKTDLISFIIHFILIDCS